MVTPRNTFLFGRILTRTNATCGSNLWRRSLNTLTRPFITTVVMNHEPYRSWRNDTRPMRKMSQSVWSMSMDTLTVRANFRVNMRSEISSWNERTNYRHPRANRRYSGHPRLSTANACGRSDRQTLSDPWALDGLESRADAQRMVDLHETLLGIEYHDRRLTYTTLQDRPREFLAATGLTHAEFAHLLPAFATAYA